MAFSRLALWVLVGTTVGVSSAACDDDTEVGPPPVDLKGTTGEASVHVTLSPFSISVRDPSGKDVLKTLAGGGDGKGYGGPAATRDNGPDGITVIPGWDGYHAEEEEWQHGNRGKVVTKSDDGASATFELAAGPGTINVDVAIEGAKVRLKTSARIEASGWNKSTVAFELPKDEHFFGLGERYATVDHRGVSLYAWAEEGGAGKGEKVPHAEDNPFPNGPSMTYFPVPFVLSSAGYGMHWATTYRTETHFGSQREDAWRVAVNATDLETIIYVHDDPLKSLDDFTRDTGRSFVPATWVFGPRRRVSLGDDFNGTPEWKLQRDNKIPITTLDDAVHFLPSNSQLGREDALKAWVQEMHGHGYKVVAYNNPYVAMNRDSIKSDFEYGKANGLFALDENGNVGESFFISGEPLTVATIDLTKQEGTAWFQSLLERTIDFGYDGWMHDFGEYVRRKWTFGDGRKGDEAHNAFPVLSAKAAHDLWMRRRPDKDFMFFVRSGYTGTQQWVPAVWGGDPEATFDETQGLPAMLRGGINLGMSGVPLWGSDISGFKCITDFPYDKEIYLRWVEVGAVSPIMEEENACSNPLGRREKWKLWNDQETIDVYRTMALLHTRLAPYFEMLAREANATGAPIMRHPFLLHPREAEAWAVQSAFYLGPSLFAAPVVERGSTVKDTWLPPGKFVDLVDHTEYEGGKHVALPAPLGKLPLLVKDGGIVPMLDPTIDTLAPSTGVTDPNVVTLDKVKDVLDVVVALSSNKEARMTLADGTELSAKRGGSGAAGRTQVETALEPSTKVEQDDLVLEAKGPTARRIRWDVTRLR